MTNPRASFIVRDIETREEWAVATLSATDPRLIEKARRQQADTSVEWVGIRLMGMPETFSIEAVEQMDRTPRGGSCRSAR